MFTFDLMNLGGCRPDKVSTEFWAGNRAEKVLTTTTTRSLVLGLGPQRNSVRFVEK